MKKLLLLIYFIFCCNLLYSQEVGYPVISEVCGTGTSINGLRDYVELYNPTSADISLKDWTIRYKSSTGSTSTVAVTIGDGKVIKSRGYFLIGLAGSSSFVADSDGATDISGSTTGGGHIALCSPGTTGPALWGNQIVVDLVGWGTANSPEGGVAAPAHPALGGSLERKALSSSTNATMAVGGAHAFMGNGYDTNNNGADFVTRTVSNPQSSLSPIEEPDYVIVFNNTFPSISSLSTQSFNININANRAGKAYYVVVADGEQAPSVAQIVAGLKSDGTNAISSGTLNIVSANTDYLFSVANLQLNTDYDIYVVAENSHGRFQTSSTKLEAMTQGTLPVTLTSFTAKLKSNSIELKWTTASENNNSHFVLLASNDGKKWEEIQKIVSKGVNGNSTANIDYTYTMPLTGISLAGFGLLGLLLIPSIRNRFVRIGLLLVVVASFISCAKQDQSNANPDTFSKGKGPIYLKLVQYDFDGKSVEVGMTTVNRN